jgi:signal transduction histidine kinase
MTQKVPCEPDELRSLFLFEALTDEQLAVLCTNGHIENYQPGPICVEGEPATCFYVLIEGELTMSKLSGGQDIETNRTSQRGVYAGAWRAFTGGKQKTYDASVHVTKPSRFFVMDAPIFAQFMRDQFPMAVHLLDGIAVGTDRTRRIIDNREKLLALGRLSAGLTHQLNNPAAAISRAASDLRERVANMRHKLAMLADGTISPEALSALVRLQERVAEQVAKSASVHLSALETSDLEDAIGDWLEDHGVEGGWDIAPTFVEGGIDTDWLERISTVSDELPSASLEMAIRWINYTIESELLMSQILEASKRISALVADAKQYSQMDRAPFQVANVHDLLHSTLVMFADRLTKDGTKDAGGDPVITLVKDFDKSLPEIPCYPGDLNQVWTNIIDNAIAAMRGNPGSQGGTLTVRTCRFGDNMARVEICDTGPGIPADIREHIFEPFFTTKPFGEGTGLGLDLAFNIVVKKHRGDLRVESVPGDTRFIVLLPLEVPPALDPALSEEEE